MLHGVFPGMGAPRCAALYDPIADDSKDYLERLCNKLIAAGGACVVLRNEPSLPASLPARGKNRGDLPRLSAVSVARCERAREASLSAIPRTAGVSTITQEARKNVEASITPQRGATSLVRCRAVGKTGSVRSQIAFLNSIVRLIEKVEYSEAGEICLRP